MYYIINIPGFLQVIDYARLFEEQSKVAGNDPTKAVAHAGARRRK